MVTHNPLTTDKANRKFFNWAVRTVPVNPTWGGLYFTARGIVFPHDHNFARGEEAKTSASEKRYIAECRARNVIPYSQMKVQHIPKKGFELGSVGFNNHNFEEGFYQLCLDEKLKPETERALQLGGRVYSVEVPFIGEDAFNDAIGSYMSTLLKRDYVLNGGLLQFAVEDMHYGGIVFGFKDSEVRKLSDKSQDPEKKDVYVLPKNGGLVLELESRVKEPQICREQVAKLTRWFNRLS